MKYKIVEWNDEQGIPNAFLYSAPGTPSHWGWTASEMTAHVFDSLHDAFDVFYRIPRRLRQRWQHRIIEAEPNPIPTGASSLIEDSPLAKPLQVSDPDVEYNAAAQEHGQKAAESVLRMTGRMVAADERESVPVLGEYLDDRTIVQRLEDLQQSISNLSGWMGKVVPSKTPAASIMDRLAVLEDRLYVLEANKKPGTPPDIANHLDVPPAKKEENVTRTT